LSCSCCLSVFFCRIKNLRRRRRLSLSLSLTAPPLPHPHLSLLLHAGPVSFPLPQPPLSRALSPLHPCNFPSSLSLPLPFLSSCAAVSSAFWPRERQDETWRADGEEARECGGGHSLSFPSSFEPCPLQQLCPAAMKHSGSPHNSLFFSFCCGAIGRSVLLVCLSRAFHCCPLLHQPSHFNFCFSPLCWLAASSVRGKFAKKVVADHMTRKLKIHRERGNE
jgi:hypothetical protein